MTNRPTEHDPLTAEELELAALLRDVDPVRGPGASLDAKILAMAADPATNPTVVPLKPKARWPQIVGLAATVSFASFILWRYQAVDDFDQRQRTMEVANDRAPVAIQQVAPAIVPGNPQSGMTSTDALAQAQSLPEPRDMEILQSAPTGKRESSPSAFEQPPATVAAASKDAAVTAALPASAAAPPTAPAAPPAPPPPAAMAAARAQIAQDAAVEMAGRQQAESTQRAQSAMQARSAKHVAADVVRAPVTLVPDVSMDDDHGPERWLQAINQRAQRGDEVGARESLRLYLQRYPSANIPDELERFRP